MSLFKILNIYRSTTSVILLCCVL